MKSGWFVHNMMLNTHDEYKLGVLHHPAPHIELYSEPHRSASAICGAMVYGCAIDFLFLDNGKTQMW